MGRLFLGGAQDTTHKYLNAPSTVYDVCEIFDMIFEFTKKLESALLWLHIQYYMHLILEK